jgi:hypothetical protein
MARTCTICRHEDRPAIDQALVNRRPFRDIACHFNVGRMALLRHHDDHLPAAMAKAKEAEEAAQADDLLKEVRALRTKAYSLLIQAEKSGDLRTALAGVREARACLELLAEMSQQLDRRPVVNLLVLPEWLRVRAELLAALQPYPEARSAVAARLAALDAPNGHRG